MDVTSEYSLEEILQEQVNLYWELLDYLREERGILSKPEVELIWNLSHKKQSIISDIESLWLEVIDMISEYYEEPVNIVKFDDLLTIVHPDDYSRFEQIFATLTSLKDEIKSQAEENKYFVEDCLNYIDDIMESAVGNEKDIIYDKEMKIQKNNPNNILLNKEV